jgi:hypothetical protein
LANLAIRVYRGTAAFLVILEHLGFLDILACQAPLRQAVTLGLAAIVEIAATAENRGIRVLVDIQASADTAEFLDIVEYLAIQALAVILEQAAIPV